jgi:hypothetical protein
MFKRVAKNFSMPTGTTRSVSVVRTVCGGGINE